MKTAFSLFLLAFSFKSVACEISSPIVSLSGPVTLFLEELNLLNDKNLKAISNFNPILESSTAEVLAGGIFMSQRVFKKFNDSTFIIDKSKELERSFKSFGHDKYKVIETKGLDSFDSYTISKEIVSPFLLGCEKKILNLEKRFTKIQTQLKKKEEKKIIFFLGEIKSKLPELVIGQDGFVLTLKKWSKLKTYQSELAYIPWSQKEMRLYTDYEYIGVSTHKKKGLFQKNIREKQKNIYHRGVLTPGIGQLLFLEDYLGSR